MTVQIIQYSLFFHNREGFSPYHQVNQFGVEFDGGYYQKDGCYIGYLKGSPDKIELVINSLGAFNVLAIDEELAALLILDAIGTSFVNEQGETKYYGIPFQCSETKKMEVPILDKEPDNLPIVSDNEKNRMRVIRKIRNGIYNALTTKLLQALNTSNTYEEFKTKMLVYLS